MIATGVSTSRLRERHGRVRAALDAAGLARTVVTHLPNVQYLTNFSGTTAIAVVSADRVALITDSRYVTAVEAMQAGRSACPDMDLVAVNGSYEETLAHRLFEGPGPTGIEGGTMTVGRFRWLEARLGTQVPLVVTERLVERLRAVKDPDEVDLLRAAAWRLDEAMDRIWSAVAPGRAERDIAADIDWALRHVGFDKPAFDTIVASGPNSALPHGRPGDRTLATGDLVVLDFGGVLSGYCSDLTRTVSVGSPGPEAHRVFEAVRAANQQAIATVRPGILPSEVDAAARSVLAAHGLDRYFGHGTGHGLGLEVHEEPRVARPRPELFETPLEPGMVFTVEPGAYLPSWGGVRIEDDVLVTAGGSEVLTRVPRDLREC